MSATRSCPNTTAGGCRCPEHHPGLAAYTTDPVTYAAALERIRPTVLRVVTMPTEPATACAGTMTCSCDACQRERSARVDRGPSQGDRQQPWIPRPARHLRAA